MLQEFVRATLVHLEAGLGSVVDAHAQLSKKVWLVEVPKPEVSGEKVAKCTPQTRVVTEFANSCGSSVQNLAEKI
ncbi:hypothetical protein YK56LOC_64100 [Caballeronia sp. HLA56]